MSLLGKKVKQEIALSKKNSTIKNKETAKLTMDVDTLCPETGEKMELVIGNGLPMYVCTKSRIALPASPLTT